jgi:hypothetical protein
MFQKKTRKTELKRSSKVISTYVISRQHENDTETFSIPHNVQGIIVIIRVDALCYWQLTKQDGQIITTITGTTALTGANPR